MPTAQLRRSWPLALAVLAILAVAVVAALGRPAPVATPDPLLGATGAEGWPVCRGDEWSVRYPPDWYVHPADLARDLPECALFAREPFDADPEEDGGWRGAQVVLGLRTGCRGSFEVAVSEEQLDIDGFPAWRRGLRDGHLGEGRATAYEYFINLDPGAACEVGSWFYARTEADDPGDFQVNRAVLDEMIATLDLRDAD